MTDAEAEQQANTKMQQGLESSLPKVLEAMWDVSRVDIESTVNAVVDKVLNDHSAGVNDEIRQLRAMAVQLLGETFQRHAAEAGVNAGGVATSGNARERFERAARNGIG